jgi:hypothetical protein
MGLKNQKFNLQEIYNSCLKKPYDEWFIVAVMRICKAIITIGWTENLKKAIILSQKVIQDIEEAE